MQSFECKVATTTKVCPKHGEYQARIVGGVALGICPKCAEESYEKKCDEVIAENSRKHKERLYASRIPKRFRDRMIETFATKHDKRAAKVLEIAWDYVADFKTTKLQGRSLVFCGNPGTGKTHLACGIAHRIMGEGHTALYTTLIDLVLDIKRTWGRESEFTEQEVISRYSVPELLILDEVGVQFGTDTERQILFRVINRRYEEVLPTILISNLGLSDLVEMVGERTLDRFNEGGGKIIPFAWQSYRG